jgi:chromosome segregation ATPase
MQALKDRLRDEASGIRGWLEAIQRRWNPALAAEKTQARRREIAQQKRRQQKERRDYLVLLEQNRQQEIAALKETQAQDLRAHADKTAEEINRYIREREDALRLEAELKSREKERDQEPEKDGPEWPPPSRAR